MSDRRRKVKILWVFSLSRREVTSSWSSLISYLSLVVQGRELSLKEFFSGAPPLVSLCDWV